MFANSKGKKLIKEGYKKYCKKQIVDLTADSKENGNKNEVKW